MRILLLKLLCLSPLYILAQKDSSVYFLKQLNKKQPDSVQAYFNIKLSDLYADKNPSQALAYSKKAFQLATRIGSDRLIYSATNNLAKNFLNLGTYDSSLYYAKQCNDAAAKLQDPSFIFNAFNLTGNIYLEKNELSKARKAYDEALKFSATNLTVPHLCHIYHNLGNYYYKAFNFKKSIEILKQGEAIALLSKDQDDIMNIYSTLGLMYAYTGKADSAQNYLLTSLDYFHKSGRIRNEAVVNQRLGSLYALFNNNYKMEQYMDIAYDQFKSIGDNITAINTLLLKVNTYFRSYQFDKCLQTLNITELFSLKNKQAKTLGTTYVYKSAIFSLMQDTVLARKYQQMAEQISHEIDIPAFTQMNMMIKAIVVSTQIRLNQGDPTIKKALLSAKDWVSEPLINATMESFTMNKKLINSNKEEISDVYKQLVSPDSSKNKQKFDSLTTQQIDSSFSALVNKQLQELEMQYKTRQKEDTILTQKQLIAIKNNTINTRNYFLAGLAVLAFLILLLFLRSSSQEKKINRQYTDIQQLQSELTHRTGNFFNSIKGMLAVASATTTDSKTISSLNSRVATISHLYTTLYSSPGKSQLPFSELLTSICNDFEHSFGSQKQIKVYQQANATISKDEAVPLAFIITELLTNAEKYAFEGKDAGEIHVEVSEDNDKRILHVWDTGKGKDENAKPRQGSQGASIIRSYSKNLSGTFTSWNDNGFHFKMEF